MSAAAAPEVAKRAIVSSAFSVGSCSRPTVSGSSRICAPADSISELNQTTKPSYWFALHLDQAVAADPLGLRRASRPRSSGSFSTLSLRYQRSWVLEVNGAA